MVCTGVSVPTSVNLDHLFESSNCWACQPISVASESFTSKAVTSHSGSNLALRIFLPANQQIHMLVLSAPKHLHNVETRFECLQAFLSLDFQ